MKPIVFNEEDVRSILAERKVMARIIDKDLNTPIKECATLEDIVTFSPPFYRFDILYVQEIWSFSNGKYIYKGNYNKEKRESYESIEWRSPETMPEEAARIFLKVINVGMERLWCITKEDAEKEGCAGKFFGSEKGIGSVCEYPIGVKYPQQKEFIEKWDKRIDTAYLDIYGWNANPFVWVVEFKKIGRFEAKW